MSDPTKILHETKIEGQFPITLVLWDDNGVQFYGNEGRQENTITLEPDMFKQVVLVLKEKGFIV